VLPPCISAIFLPLDQGDNEMGIPRIAVVGMGGFARTHHQYVQSVEEAGLGRQVAQVAIAADQAAYADELKELEGRGVHVFASLREMLAQARAEVEVVCIPTGIPLHRPMAIAALEADCNVLVEKPAAGSIQDVDAMLAVEAKSKGFCAVGYQHAYSPDYLRVKELVCSGKLGRIKEVRAFGCWPRDPSYYGRNGWAGQLAVGDTWVLDSPHNNALAHAVNIMCIMASAQEGKALRPLAVQAELYRANAIESADTVALRAETDEGVNLFFAVSHCTEETVHPIFVVRGDKGEVELDYFGGAQVRYTDGETEEWKSADAGPLVLENVVKAIAGQGDLLCPLALTRAQTLCVCGTFESSPIHPLPQELQRVEEGGRIAVEGMTALVMKAWQEAALFSELGVEWARAGRRITMDDYAYFPTFRPAVGLPMAGDR
jgi:predicted dehydrogenase